MEASDSLNMQQKDVQLGQKISKVINWEAVEIIKGDIYKQFKDTEQSVSSQPPHKLMKKKDTSVPFFASTRLEHMVICCYCSKELGKMRQDMGMRWSITLAHVRQAEKLCGLGLSSSDTKVMAGISNQSQQSCSLDSDVASAFLSTQCSRQRGQNPSELVG